MKNIILKIGTWIFLGPALNAPFRIDNILRVAIINMIALLEVAYIMLFFEFMLIEETDSFFYVVIAYVFAFVFSLSFAATHTNIGLKHFDLARAIVILNTMCFHGFIYVNVICGNIWSFLIPIMIIFLASLRPGLILCSCFFAFVLVIEFTYNIHVRDMFACYTCIFWSQVLIASAYETLRMKQNKRLLKDRKKIEILSITDHLTKLYNRRYFSESMNKEFARAIRQKENLCFLMIDADKFKDYNDTYGHLQGDELLIALADIFKEIIKRPSDLVFRMGGEEFGVLLPNTDFNGAFLIAEKIREEVQNKTKTTVSVGVACILPQVGDTSDKLLKLADNNLYKAKEMGRNKVIG